MPAGSKRPRAHVRLAACAAALAPLAAATPTATAAVGPKTAMAVAVARQMWGVDRCPGGVRHRWVTDAERPRDAAGHLLVSERSPAWVMVLGNCEVQFYEPNAQWYTTPEIWCRLIVHEYGHAVAAVPDGDPRWPVMDTRLLADFPPCRRAARRFERNRLRERRARARTSRHPFFYSEG